MSENEITPSNEEFASLDEEITAALEDRTMYVAFGGAVEDDPDHGIVGSLPSRTQIDVALYLSLYDVLNLKGKIAWRLPRGMYRVTLIDLEGDEPLLGRSFASFMVDDEVYGEIESLVQVHLTNKLSHS